MPALFKSFQRSTNNKDNTGHGTAAYWKDGAWTQIFWKGVMPNLKIKLLTMKVTEQENVFSVKEFSDEKQRLGQKYEKTGKKRKNGEKQVGENVV